MHDHDPSGPAAWTPDEQARWLHALRNAVGTAGVALRLGRRLLADHDEDGARELMQRADDALDSCRRLLSGYEAAAALTPPATRADPRAPKTPRAHR